MSYNPKLKLYKKYNAMNFNIDFAPRNHAGTIPKGKIRQNIKFGAVWCVFLTKIKVDPESWYKKFSNKQPRKKKIPKDKFI